METQMLKRLAPIALMLLSQAAAAQPYPPQAWYAPHLYESACQPECAQDYAPCDPYYFKRADQRCNTNHRYH
jgi:hypothetical protein